MPAGKAAGKAARVVGGVAGEAGVAEHGARRCRRCWCACSRCRTSCRRRCRRGTSCLSLPGGIGKAMPAVGGAVVAGALGVEAGVGEGDGDAAARKCHCRRGRSRRWRRQGRRSTSGCLRRLAWAARPCAQTAALRPVETITAAVDVIAHRAAERHGGDRLTAPWPGRRCRAQHAALAAGSSGRRGPTGLRRAYRQRQSVRRPS